MKLLMLWSGFVFCLRFVLAAEVEPIADENAILALREVVLRNFGILDLIKMSFINKELYDAVRTHLEARYMNMGPNGPVFDAKLLYRAWMECDDADVKNKLAYRYLCYNSIKAIPGLNNDLATDFERKRGYIFSEHFDPKDVSFAFEELCQIAELLEPAPTIRRGQYPWIPLFFHIGHVPPPGQTDKSLSELLADFERFKLGRKVGFKDITPILSAVTPADVKDVVGVLKRRCERKLLELAPSLVKLGYSAELLIELNETGDNLNLTLMHLIFWGIMFDRDIDYFAKVVGLEKFHSLEEQLDSMEYSTDIKDLILLAIIKKMSIDHFLEMEGFAPNWDIFHLAVARGYETDLLLKLLAKVDFKLGFCLEMSFIPSHLMPIEVLIAFLAVDDRRIYGKQRELAEHYFKNFDRERNAENILRLLNCGHVLGHDIGNILRVTCLPHGDTVLLDEIVKFIIEKKVIVPITPGFHGNDVVCNSTCVAATLKDRMRRLPEEVLVDYLKAVGMTSSSSIPLFNSVFEAIDATDPKYLVANEYDRWSVEKLENVEQKFKVFFPYAFDAGSKTDRNRMSVFKKFVLDCAKIEDKWCLRADIAFSLFPEIIPIILKIPIEWTRNSDVMSLKTLKATLQGMPPKSIWYTDKLFKIVVEAGYLEQLIKQVERSIPSNPDLSGLVMKYVVGLDFKDQLAFHRAIAALDIKSKSSK